MDEKMITVTSPLLPSLDDFLPYLQANVWHFQILAQSPLQFLMVMPVICNPFARPNIL